MVRIKATFWLEEPKAQISSRDTKGGYDTYATQVYIPVALEYNELKTRQLRKTDIVIGSRCLAHVASNAIMHGLRPYCSDQILKDAYNAIEGLRNASTGLHAVVDEFIPLYAVFDRTVCAESERLWWSILGVPPIKIQNK